MKLFKNRGDIYLSKTKTKANKEQRILLILLTFIVVFTLIFVLFLGMKYDFSMKKFFTPEGIVLDEDFSDIQELPKVSGKNNYLFLITGKDEETLYLSALIQFDMENTAYKVCNLMPDTVLDGNKMSKIFKIGGGANTMAAVEKSLAVEMDYYVIMRVNDLRDFYDDMGKISYPLAQEIKYKDNGADSYNLRLKAGEANLEGKQFCSLLRYYINEKKDTRSANELVLNALGQLINEQNAQKRENHFRTFMALSNTNITVKDFSQNNDNITVLSDETVGVNSYNIEAEYSGDNLNSTSIGDIKNYFSK